MRIGEFASAAKVDVETVRFYEREGLLPSPKRLVNGYRVHDYEWSQVLAVTLKPGSPWAVMDLSDGTSVSAIGIQGSDGPRAVRQVKQLRTLVEENSRTERVD